MSRVQRTLNRTCSESNNLTKPMEAVQESWEAIKEYYVKRHYRHWY